MSFYGLRSNTRIIDLKRRLRCDGRRAAQSKPKEWRRASQGPTRIAPVWKSAHAVRWNKRGGIFCREVGDGEHAFPSVSAEFEGDTPRQGQLRP